MPWDYRAGERLARERQATVVSNSASAVVAGASGSCLIKGNISGSGKLQKNVNKAVEDLDSRKRDDAIKTLKAKAKEMGFTMVELTGSSSRKKPASKPKFRHPENPSMTWSGRGRQPAWIKEAVENGQSMDDFLIDKTA